jgi:hypothetical protein
MKSQIEPSKLTPNTRWIIQLEEDPDTGDLVMPLPPELMATQGWEIGDTLTWNIDDEGTVILTKDPPKLESGS